MLASMVEDWMCRCRLETAFLILVADKGSFLFWLNIHWPGTVAMLWWSLPCPRFYLDLNVSPGWELPAVKLVVALLVTGKLPLWRTGYTKPTVHALAGSSLAARHYVSSPSSAANSVWVPLSLAERRHQKQSVADSILWVWDALEKHKLLFVFHVLEMLITNSLWFFP